MATLISEFEDLVAEDVDNCESSLLTRNTKRSILEFCDKSWILNKDFTHTYTSTDIDTSNNNALDIDVDDYVTDLRLSSFIRLMIDNEERYVHESDLLNDIPNYDSKYDLDTIHFLMYNETTLRLFNINTSSSTAYIQLALKPLMSATSVDDKLWEDWADPIAAGAKWRLQSKPNRPYSDRSAAQENRMLFHRGIREAKSKVQRGFSARDQELIQVPFGGYDLWSD